MAKVVVPEKGKMKCWQFKKCGREKDRSCPVFAKADAKGKKAPDMDIKCWLIDHTLCSVKGDGPMLNKLETCKECEFYINVKSGKW